MTTNKTIMNYEELISITESLGWNVIENKDTLHFFITTPAQQSFSFDLDKKKDIKDLLQSLDDYRNNFNVSSETYRWLDETGHGKNGAPHNMMDVYKDFEWCGEALFYLFCSLFYVEPLIQPDLSDRDTIYLGTEWKEYGKIEITREQLEKASYPFTVQGAMNYAKEHMNELLFPTDGIYIDDTHVLIDHLAEQVKNNS